MSDSGARTSSKINDEGDGGGGRVDGDAVSCSDQNVGWRVS